MIDIHSHFLPGIDDGAKDQQQTLKLLKQAEDTGITDLVATPHFNEFIQHDYAKKIYNVVDETNALIHKNNIRIKVHVAGEFLIDGKILDWDSHNIFFHGINNNYLLFELSHFFEFSDISDLIFKLKLQNITPVLAHPERSLKIQENPEKIIHWIQQGCVLQMNAGSILGQFGKRCQNRAKRMLDSGMIHLLASDAHEPKHRNFSVLSHAKQFIEQNYDEEFAEILFQKNPSNILNSKPVKFFNIASENLKQNRFSSIINKFRLSPK